MRDSFDKYYIPLVEIKYFNILIDNKPFFDRSPKRQEANAKIVKMPRNNGYAKESLLNYLYYPNFYKLIGTDLSRQTNTNIFNKLMLQENLTKTMVQQYFSLLKSSKKIIEFIKVLNLLNKPNNSKFVTTN